MNQGELVLIKIDKDIREGHKLRAKATGPWRITAVLNDAVEVKDAFTGRQLMDRLTHLPDRINVDRLLRFAGNVEEMEYQELEDLLDS